MYVMLNSVGVRGQVGNSPGALLKAGRRQRAVSDTSFRHRALYVYVATTTLSVTLYLRLVCQKTGKTYLS